MFKSDQLRKLKTSKLLRDTETKPWDADIHHVAFGSRSAMNSLLHLTDFECIDTQQRWRKTARAHLNVLHTPTRSRQLQVQTTASYFKPLDWHIVRARKSCLIKLTRMSTEIDEAIFTTYSIASSSALTPNSKYLITKTTLLSLLLLLLLLAVSTCLVRVLLRLTTATTTATPPQRTRESLMQVSPFRLFLAALDSIENGNKKCPCFFFPFDSICSHVHIALLSILGRCQWKLCSLS